MKPNCPSPECILSKISDPKPGLIVSNGFFYRHSDSRKIRRFFCRNCGLYFSHASLNPCLNQKKRRINFKLFELISSGVSQRRAALILGVNRKTVVRRFRFLAGQARLAEVKRLSLLPPKSLRAVQFDDLETSEHTKCKPLSVALAIEPNTRQILGFQVSAMPAKGLLANKARKKYGYRKDQRRKGWDQLFKLLRPLVDECAVFTSDENSHYPRPLKLHYPSATHIQVKGGRGCVTGQGELKKLRFDPLFALNHTCAMLRANMNRLFRRTWCTSKNIKGLEDHLAIYVRFHNTRLIAASAGWGAS